MRKHRSRLRRAESAAAVLLLPETLLPRPEPSYFEQLAEVIYELGGHIPFLRPIEALILDPEISDIMVNGSSRVFIEKHGELLPVPDANSEKSLQVAVRNIARSGG